VHKRTRFSLDLGTLKHTDGGTEEMLRNYACSLKNTRSIPTTRDPQSHGSGIQKMHLLKEY